MSDERRTLERFLAMSYDRRATVRPSCRRAADFTSCCASTCWAVVGVRDSSPLRVTFFKEQYLALFLALGLGSVFLAIKTLPQPDVGDNVPWFDWLLALGGLAVGLFVTSCIRPLPIVLAYSRPTAGSSVAWRSCYCSKLPAAVAGGRSHGLRSADHSLHPIRRLHVPGSFTQRALRGRASPAISIWTPTRMLGLPLDVAAGVVVAFILFGQALYAVGGDKFLTDLALIATGRYRGGPAKVSVVSSALFGTVSGSAVANVVVDGAITIPLMKSTGFPRISPPPSKRSLPTAARSCRRSWAPRHF